MDVRATYKALADFSSLNRSSKRSERHLRDLRQEAVKTQAALAGLSVGDIDKDFGKVAKSSEKTRVSMGKTKKETDSLQLSFEDLGEGAEQLGLDLNRVTEGVARVSKGAKEGKGDVDAYTKSVKDSSTEARKGRRDHDRLGDAMAKVGNDAGGARRNVRGLGNAFKEASDGARGLRGILKLLIIPSVIVGVNALVGAINALAAGAAAAVGSLGPLLGVMGAIPGLAGAAAASIGTLFLGFRGLGDALKGLEKSQKKQATTARKAGRTQERAARGIERAERNLVKSQEAVLEAQEAVNEARQEAIDNLRQLRNQLENDALAEEDAAIRIMEARDALTDTIQDQTSSYTDVVRAEFEIRRAEQDLEDVQASRAETAEELADAEAKGIENSDAVTDANERLEDAVWNLEEAEFALADAMEAMQVATAGTAAAVNDAAEAFNKLGPNAQRFVLALQTAREEMEKISRAVQETLLPDVQVALEALVALGKRLQDEFVSLAKVFGGGFLDVGELLGEEAFVADVESLFGMTNELVEMLLGATLSVIRGLTDVAIVAQDMTKWLVGLIETAAQAFEDWAEVGRETGTLAESFENTMSVLEQWGRILFDLGGGLRDLFNIGEEEIGFLDSLENMADKFYEWTNSLEGENEIRQYFEDAREPLRELMLFLGEIVRAFGRLGSQPELAELIRKLREEFLPSLEGLLDSVTSALGPALVDLLTNLADLASVVFGEGGGGFVAFVETLNLFLETIVGLAENVPFAAEAISALFIALGAGKGIRAIGAVTGVTKLAKGVRRAQTAASVATATDVAAVGGAGVVQRFTKKGRAARAAAPAKAGKLAKAGKAMKGAKFIGPALTALAAIPLGPVLAVVGAIAAIGGALFALYKNNEGFRNFIDGAWQAIQNAFRVAMAVVIPLLKDLGEWIVMVWQEWIYPALLAFGRFVQTVWQDYIHPILSTLLSVWGAVFGAVVTIVKAWWKVVAAIFGLVWDVLSVTVFPILRKLWDVAKWVFEKVAGVVSWFWNNVVQPVLSKLIDFVKDHVIPGIQTFADNAARIFENVAGFIEGMRDRFADAIDKIKGAFDGLKNFLGTVFEVAVRLVTAPVEFLVNDILDGMIIASINKVLDFLGIGKTIPRINFTAPTFSAPSSRGTGGSTSRAGGRFNKGGRVPGSGPDRDTVTARLTPGEFVIRRKAVQQIGLANLHALNRGYNDGGEVEGGDGGLLGNLGRLAGGGVDFLRNAAEGAVHAGKFMIGKGVDLARSGAAEGFDLAMSPVRELVGGLNIGGAWGDMLRGVMTRVLDNASTFIRGKEAEFGGGNLAGDEFSRGGNWPPRQFGKVASNTARAAQFVRSAFGVNDVGTLGSRPNKSDHPYGKALDAMVYDNTPLGTRIASWFTKNPREFGTKYVVWHDQINTGSGWRAYTHPNGPTNNPTLRHLDHVHVSFLNRGGEVGRGYNSGGLVGGPSRPLRFGGGLSSARSVMGTPGMRSGGSVSVRGSADGNRMIHIENLNVINPKPADPGESLVRGMRRSQQILDAGRRR